MDEFAFLASGWDLMTQLRKTQHRIEVAMDQSLEVVLASKEPHIAEIARRLRVTRQAARDSVLKLERSDLVDTIREAHQVYVHPTARARRQIARIRSFGDVAERLEEALGPAERARLFALLRQVDTAARPPRRPYWWLETT